MKSGFFEKEPNMVETEREGGFFEKEKKEVNRKYPSPTSFGRLEEPNMVENGKGKFKTGFAKFFIWEK